VHYYNWKFPSIKNTSPQRPSVAHMDAKHLFYTERCSDDFQDVTFETYCLMGETLYLFSLYIRALSFECATITDGDYFSATQSWTCHNMTINISYGKSNLPQSLSPQIVFYFLSMWW
jgi:hypothetical protein